MSQIILAENASAPATPASGKSIIYPKADGLWYTKDDAGAETPLGAGITALTGDVTASGAGSQAATIAAGAVTYAKMQDVSATARILARKTAGAGDVEEATISEVLNFIASVARGDIIYRGASTWDRLAIGAAGYVFRSDGTDAAWGPAVRVTPITSDAAPTPNCDTTDLYDVTALATAPTFGAPTGTPYNGQKLIIRIKDDATPRALTWNAVYVAGGTDLPSTTVASKILHVGFIYNTANALNKWMCVGSQQEA